MILKEYNLSVRLPQERAIDTGITLVQNDKDVYKLNVRIFDGVNEIDYTDVDEATITFLKSDKNVVQGNMAVEADQLSYTLGTNEIACPGKVLVSIQLFGSTERLSTARFVMSVERDLVTAEAVQSTSEFSILQQLKQDLEAIDVVELTSEFNAHLAEYAAMQFGSIPYTTTQNITYYIDGVSGNDSNNGLTSSTAFKTWAKTESMIPLHCLHDVTIRIIGNLNETISISNRFCKSPNRITVRGDTTTPSAHQINGISACTCAGIRFQYLRINGPVLLSEGLNNDVRNCEPQKPGGVGIQAQYGIYYITSNDFGNNVVEDAIYAVGSRVFSANNIGNATQYGLNATVASTIGKAGTQPTGSVANENITTGSVIRA